MLSSVRGSSQGPGMEQGSSPSHLSLSKQWRLIIKQQIEAVPSRVAVTAEMEGLSWSESGFFFKEGNWSWM